MGHPTLRRKLMRDVRRSWPLFAALSITVMLGIALYAAADNSYRNLQNSYDNAFVVQDFPDLFVTGGDVAAVARDAEASPDVAASRTRVQVDLPISVDRGGGTDKLVGRIIGYPRNGTPEVAALTSLSGSTNPSPGMVLVEEHMADTFGLVPGSTVELATAAGRVEVEVAGVVNSAEYLWPAPSRQEIIVPPESFGVLFVSESDARAWSGGEANQALVLLSDDVRGSAAEPDTVQSLESLALAAGATEVLDRSEQPSNALLQEDISGFEQMAVAFPALFLSAAALTLYVLLTRRVAEERQIIGTLRAQGVRGRTIGWHYMSYGLLAGLVGAVLGLPLGMALAGWMSRLYVGVIGLPEQLTVFGGFGATTVVTGLAFAILATGLAAVFPARRAAKIEPAEAMRGEQPRAVRGRSWVERVLPGRVPATWRMVLRSIGRNAKRTVFTAAGVAMALILVLVSVGMVDTMNSLISVQFSTVSTANAQVDYAGPVTAAQRRAVASVAGVQRVETVIDQPVSIGYGDRVYATRFTAFDSDTAMHGFITPGGDTVPLPADGVLVDEAIAAQIPDLQPGDTVQLAFPAIDSVVAAPVAGFTYQPLGTFVYADKEWAADNIPQAASTTVLLQTSDGADADAVRRAVSDSPGVLGYVETSALEDTYNEYAGLFYVFVFAMLALGAVMAFAIIFTTMSVNIVERQRELATLRAAGVRYRAIAGLVGGENTIVAALGVIPGLVLGVIAAAAMLQSYSSDQFTLTLDIQPLTLVLSAAAIMAVAVVSQWPGLRAVRKMDVAQVVRERAA